jgi:hypothetical protein
MEQSVQSIMGATVLRIGAVKYWTDPTILEQAVVIGCLSQIMRLYGLRGQQEQSRARAVHTGLLGN